MKARVRAWLDETHSAGFELVRHFLARFFDSEMVATPGEWTKVAVGAIALLVSVGALMLPSYWQRYNHLLSDGSSPLEYQQGVRDDISTFIAVAMWITTLLTAVQWQSLFPSLRDCLALASLPVKPLEIFRAKFSALLLMFGALAFTLAVPTALLFTAASSGRWRENPSLAVNMGATFLAIAGGCAFVFFGLVALQGLLLNILPGRWFGRVSTAVQGSVCILTLGVLPFLGKQLAGPTFWPPNWFLGLWAAVLGAPDAAGRNALLAIGVAPAVAILSYLISYHRCRRLLLEAPMVRTRRRCEGLGSRLLELWIRDPREQAAFAFIWKSLARSRNHRLVLLAYGGIALGCILNGASGSADGLHASAGSIRYLAVLGPVTVAIFVVAALRYLFSLPVELRANWVFRTTEKECCALWLRAVARFVVCCGVVPVFAFTFPVSVAVLGFTQALRASTLGFTLALAEFEALFVQWQKLPFACSYLPGKRSLLATLQPYLMALPALAAVGRLFLYCLDEPTAFLSVAIFQVAAWWRLRKMRRDAWAHRALCYEESREPEVMTLGLTVGQALSPATVPRPSAALFSDSFVASRRTRGFAWLDDLGEGVGMRFWLDTLLEDIGYGFRLIRRSAALSTVLVLTLTIGIGMNVSVFTLINAVAFRARVDLPESFVTVIPKYLGGSNAWMGEVSPSEYLAYRDGTRTLSSLAVRVQRPVTIGEGDPGSWAALVSCNFFSVYALEQAKIGRLFLPAECAVPGGAPVAVIAEELWRDRFGSDPRIVGQVIRVNQQAFTVVGIAPARFAGRLFRSSLWIPYTAQPYLERHNFFLRPEPTWLTMDGRLAAGFSRSQAQAELAIIARQLDRLTPGRKTTLTVTNGSLLASLDMKGNGPDAYWLLACTMGALSMVLLITCANVTTLLLSKAVVRQREIAVRLSLGAARVRLLRMLLTESLLVAGLAGAVSVWLAYRLPGILYQFIAQQPPDFPLAPDWWIFAYASAAVLVTGTVAGLAPALESLKVDLTAAMKGCGSILSKACGGTGLHGILVTSQVALSLVLLVAAGFVGQAYWRVAGPNYPTRNILVVPLRFPERNTYAASKALFRRIAEQVRALPGVQSVTYDGQVPLLLPNIVRVRLEGQPDQSSRPVDVQDASPGYFRTMGIPLVRGREFRESDISTNPDYVPAIVSESFVRAFGFREDPTGQHFVAAPGITVEVIGVAKDVDSGQGPDTPVAYSLGAMAGDRTFVLIRFAGPAQASAGAVRVRIAAVDPDLKVAPRTLQAFIDDEAEDLWRSVELVLILGLTAFVLAATGIYGAVAFTVRQRTRDLGIRVALGAQKLDILREVLLSGGRPVMHGLLVGLWLALVGAAAIRQAFRYTPIRLDTGSPTVYAGAALLLTVAALVAMLGPARRASGTDPLGALSSE